MAGKKQGSTGLSIGIQSFFEEDLQWMNRAHNAQQAIDNLQLAIKHFNNITIDLIYGTPGLTNEKWKQNVETAIVVEYSSSFLLCTNSRTQNPLHKMIQAKKEPKISIRINNPNNFYC